jgi:hypothetical protein
LSGATVFSRFINARFSVTSRIGESIRLLCLLSPLRKDENGANSRAGYADLIGSGFSHLIRWSGNLFESGKTKETIDLF